MVATGPAARTKKEFRHLEPVKHFGFPVSHLANMSNVRCVWMWKMYILRFFASFFFQGCFMPIFKTCHWLDECVQIMYVYSYIFIDICQMCVFEKHCVFLCKKLCICIYLQKMMYIYIYIHRHMSDVRLWIYVHVSIYI